MDKKKTKKILAILSVIAIIASDFIVIASNLMTYATQVNYETNNPNVEFSAYFKNESGERVDSIDKSIKSEELKLYAQVNVKNEGYFNGAIEIIDSNFNVKNNILSSAITSIENNRINLVQINAGETVEVELDIEPIIADKMNIDFLSKISIVKLNGTYTASTGSGIQYGKEVCINFQVDESAQAELETDIITNKVYSVNGTNKRIVQLWIKSRLTENQYPIEQTILKVVSPELSETNPEEVSVLAIGELATNAETTINTEDWTNENGIVQINIKNETDENNEINWSKDIYDELIVTFIYPEDVDASIVETTTNSEIKVHNSENTYTAEHKESEDTELDNIIIGNTKIATKEMYKGQLYANINSTEKQEIPYNTETKLIVTNLNIIEDVSINETPDVFGTDDSELTANTKYISTEINKDEMLEIFGQEGQIQIINGETTISLDKDTETDDNGNIVITYENSTSEIIIKTTKPEKTGVLEINHTKAITDNNYTRSQIKTIRTLKTKDNNTLELKETTTKAELEILTNGVLSTTETSNMKLGITLLTDSEQYDLYKNPTITIQLPDVVESFNVNNKSKQNASDFEVKSRTSTQTIEIVLTGEQTVYAESSLSQAYLELDLDVTVSKLAATQLGTITMTYTNENAVQYYGGAGIVEKEIEIQAPAGLVTMFNLNSNENTSRDEDIVEQITDEDAGEKLKFEIALVNNTQSDMNNVRIFGKLPTDGNTVKNKTNTLATTLKSLNAEQGTVYFSEKADATIDITDSTNGWTTNLSELSNARVFLIKLDSLEATSNLTANYEVKLPTSISIATSSYAQYTVVYDTTNATDIEIESRIVGISTPTGVDIETSLTGKVGNDVLSNGNVVRTGEVIQYTVTVTNTGTEVMQNVQIKANVPEGTVVVEPVQDYTNAPDGVYYEEKTDITEITKTVENLLPGVPYELQYEVRVKTDVTSGTEISNSAVVTYDNIPIETQELTNKIQTSKVRVTIKRATDLNIDLSAGANVRYIAYVENLTEEALTDLEVQIVPNNFTPYNIIWIEGLAIGDEAKSGNIKINQIDAENYEIIQILSTINSDAEDISIYMNVTDNEGITYRSNKVGESLKKTGASITATSPQNNSYLEEGDIVEYNVTVENTGEIDTSIFVEGEVSEYLEIQSIYVDEKLSIQSIETDDEETYIESISNVIYQGFNLEKGQTGQLKITAKLKEITEYFDEKELKIKFSAKESYLVKDFSEEIVHKIKGKKLEEIENVISGQIWLDTNENGQKDKEEIFLQGVNVLVYNTTTKEYLTNQNNDIIYVTTDENGQYILFNIEKGSYKIILDYNKEKYEPTTNSKVTTQELTIGEETNSLVATDTINFETTITNLDIALKEVTQDKLPEENPDDSEVPGDSEKPEDKPNEDEGNQSGNGNDGQGNQGNIEEIPQTQKISGLAWLDSNRNGQIDNKETYLSGIKVRLYSNLAKNYLTDENGKIIEKTTDINGNYEFDNIPKGSYVVIFEYITEAYEPTTYLANGVDTTQNSKAILKKITINGEEKTLAVTDTINVQNDVFNINIGLKENLVFDLELNKYISKIVVQTSKQTKTYEYEDSTFEKIEIHKNEIQGALVVLEYKIKIRNTGEMTGYVKNIIDYMPKGLTFSSELNTDWYISGDYLYTKSLEKVQLAPGEEKEIKLILTKTMTNDNVGLINNRAEIYQHYNEYGIADIDSTPNNLLQSEDDIGAVDVIIMVATGGNTVLHIILFIVNLILVGIAIKLMIKNEIIQIKFRR